MVEAHALGAEILADPLIRGKENAVSSMAVL
jgi:hypothetical protein